MGYFSRDAASATWIEPERLARRPPECPVRRATISPAIATAVSSGVRPDIQSYGLQMLSSSSSVTPSLRVSVTRCLPEEPS
jgi:hypothetical protein